MSPQFISVRDLSVQFDTDEGRVTAVDRITFDIAPGQILGLVGESGSGKTVTAKSLMKLNPGNAVYGSDSQIIVNLPDQQLNVLELSRARDLRVVRGGEIAMVFQEPMAGFAPALTIGSQMVETVMLHLEVSKAEATDIAQDMLQRVGIADASTRFRQYAFELSGGMRQRAMIAMALSTRPKLLIADEPTTALDVTIQAQVLELMGSLVEEFQMGILLISHDLGVIAQTCDEVAVMYLGRLVERGPVRSVIGDPKHPYTQGLLDAIPSLDNLDAPLLPIPGDIPSPLARPEGCVFHTRCPRAIEGKCDMMEPEMTAVASNHSAACFAIQADQIQRNDAT